MRAITNIRPPDVRFGGYPGPTFTYLKQALPVLIFLNETGVLRVDAQVVADG